MQHLSKYKSESEVAQLCPTLCDPMDCSLPGSSVHGIFQAIVLEWVAISFARESSRPTDWTRFSRIVDRCFTIWASMMLLISKCQIRALTLQCGALLSLRNLVYFNDKTNITCHRNWKLTEIYSLLLSLFILVLWVSPWRCKQLEFCDVIWINKLMQTI